MVGTSGNLTCFSFYANKNLSTGEGGAIVCYSERIANWLRSLRQHSLPVDAWQRFSHAKSILLAPPLEDLGYKMNYTDLQAAIGRVQLRRQAEFSARRKAIAEFYCRELAALAVTIDFQKDCLHDDHSRHLFVVGLPIEQMTVSRYEFISKLRARNIGATVHYTPLHTMPLYQHDASIKLSNTDYLTERILTLPISASMSLDDARYVTEHFSHVLKECLK
jgi:perosamine synthetase